MNKICRINAVLTEVGLPIGLMSIGNLGYFDFCLLPDSSVL